MTYLDIAARGKNAAWRYPIAVVLALALSLAIAVAVMLPLVLLRLLPADFTQQMQHATRPGPFFVATGVTFGALLASFAAAIAIVHRKSFGDMIGVWRWDALFKGIGLWGLMLVLTSLIDFALAPSAFAVTATAQTPLLLATAIPTLAVQTFAEEFVFRGYVTQGILLATRRPMLTAVLSGLVFGSVHIPNGWPQAANAVVFGIVLAAIAIRTRGLAFGFGLHMINNIYGAVAVVSGGDVFRGSPGLFTQTTPGLMWWDALTGTVALAAVALLILKGRIRVGDDQFAEGAPADIFL